MHQLRVLLSAAVAAALGATLLTSGSGAAAVGHAPRQAAHKQAAKPYVVTAKADRTELVLGQKVTITGKVTPAAAGKTVVLQQKIGDKPWKDSGTATIKKSGKYQVSDKPTTMNARKYRVVKAASDKHRKGVSKSVAVGVYQWHDVYDLAIRANQAMYRVTTLDIDTVEFPKSLEGYVYDDTDPTGFIDYNLERNCTTLKATYGMSDEADTGSSAKIDVVGDGTQLYTGTFSLLESQAKTIDIRGVFRLAFQFQSLTAEHARPAVGSPQVLCSF
jgi:hypothetical protein